MFLVQIWRLRLSEAKGLGCSRDLSLGYPSSHPPFLPAHRGFHRHRAWEWSWCFPTHPHSTSRASFLAWREPPLVQNGHGLGSELGPHHPVSAVSRLLPWFAAFGEACIIQAHGIFRLLGRGMSLSGLAELFSQKAPVGRGSCLCLVLGQMCHPGLTQVGVRAASAT